MKKISVPIVFAVLGCVTLLCACTHIPTDIKKASAQQAKDLAEFETKLKEQDLGTKCFESLKASLDMEEKLEKDAKEVQTMINEHFLDNMELALTLKDKKEAAEEQAKAISLMTEQTIALQTILVKMRAYTEEERNKCKNALETVQEIVHSFSVSQAELNKFIQADARTPMEEFLLNLIVGTFLEGKIQVLTSDMQNKMLEFSKEMQAVMDTTKQK